MDDLFGLASFVSDDCLPESIPAVEQPVRVAGNPSCNFRRAPGRSGLLQQCHKDVSLHRLSQMNPILDRREFLRLTAGAVAGTMLQAGTVSASSTGVRVEAIAFDAFPIFDPRPVFALAEEMFPGKGADLAQAWRTRQFEYTWLRTVAGRYADFWQVSEDALVFAARMLKPDLDAQRRERLMNAYLKLKTWPDVPQALRTLKAAGIRLAFLSNFTRQMLVAGINNSGLEGVFEHLLSTDEVKQFKPAPRAYQMACIWIEARGDHLHRLRRMGCRGGEMVRFSDCLGQSAECAARDVARHARCYVQRIVGLGEFRHFFATLEPNS